MHGPKLLPITAVTERRVETFRTLRQNNLRVRSSSVPRKLWENYGQHSERGKETVEHVACE